MRWQGLNRFYAVMLAKPGRLQIVKYQGQPRVLAETPLAWMEGQELEVRVEVEGSRIRANLGDIHPEAADPKATLEAGGVALLIKEGWLSCQEGAGFPARTLEQSDRGLRSITSSRSGRARTV